jgi:hypothetical protein
MMMTVVLGHRKDSDSKNRSAVFRIRCSPEWKKISALKPGNRKHVSGHCQPLLSVAIWGEKYYNRKKFETQKNI